jgi:hydrogenase-4 component B
MYLFICSILIMLAGAFAALFLAKSPGKATLAGVGGAVAGCVTGLIPAFSVVLGAGPESIRLPWHIPFGAFFLEIDPLSAFFLIPTFILCGVAAIYGGGYLKSYAGRKSLGASWFFFNILIAGMAIVLTSRNGMLFLMAWEVMTLASFFLVTFESEKRNVREAGWIYLISTHLGTAFLFVLFILLSHSSGSMDFDSFSAAGALAPSLASVLFLLSIVGFGTKAGFMPFHVWLPEAHPVAPSHVSAVMSGAMIKTGIYGIIRILTFLGMPPLWWGLLLIGIGLFSGILGVILALAQHDLKRLLAYSSVENVGIITLGLGLGLVGLSQGSPVMMALGFAGALLHVLNHAFFKGLLFLGAGSVLHGAGTLEISRLGGLLKNMPLTGALFFVGAAAISGLPPLNGFVGEFLIYLGAFEGGTSGNITAAIPALILIAGLALMGGLVAALFAKAVGIAFLGEPRSERARHSHEAGLSMTLPMSFLAAGCLLIGLLSPWIIRLMGPVLGVITRSGNSTMDAGLATAGRPLEMVTVAALCLAGLTGVLAWTRKRLLANRITAHAGTWDCGYLQPTARMQYTGASFVQPFMEFFKSLVPARINAARPEGLFPQSASFAVEMPDTFKERLYRPVFSGIARGLEKLKWLQHGRIQLYLLYIVLTLLVLFIWKL